MEDNPIANNPEIPLRIYLAACLPHLKYYNYICIKSNEIEAGSEMFRRELREIEENEKDELAAREKFEKSASDEIRLSECFVEFLNEHQLFDSLFENDPDGTTLMMIGDEALEFLEKYRIEAYELTQCIYMLGLDKHQSRIQEIQEFTECVAAAKMLAQKNGQGYVIRNI